MKIKILFLSWLLLIGNHAILKADEFIKLSPDQMSRLGIKLAEMQKVNEIPLLQAPGKIIVPPSNEQIASASQAGFIQQLAVSSGDQIKRGQILATIKSSELLAVQRNFLQSASDLQLAKVHYQRDKNLFAEGVVSKRRWMDTQANYQNLITQLNETTQLLEIAGLSKTDIKNLKNNRQLKGSLDVVSSMDGVVLKRLVQVGQKVERLQPVFHIANLNKLWIEIRVAQKHIHLIRINDQVTIPNTSVRASVVLLGSSVDPKDQTILVRAVINSPPLKNQIRVYQQVRAQIIRKLQSSAYQISASAIVRNAGESLVFVSAKKGFSVRPVNILGREQKTVIIEGDFLEKELIAIQGTVAIKAAWQGLGGEE